MSQQYPGGFITKSPPAVVGPVDGEGGSAPGVWTLDQAMVYVKQGLWPKPVLPKEIFIWGANGNGQLGQNNTANTSSPVQVGSLTTWSKIDAGDASSFGIKNDGTLWAWGSNGAGRLGVGDTAGRSSPVQVGALTDWYIVSSGQGQTLGIKTNGTLWAVGGNGSSGQLGTGNGLDVSSPIQVGALTNWSIVSAGGYFNAAIKTDGTLWTFGYSGYGRLGNNTSNGNNRSSPIQVGSLTDWSKVATGGAHTLAVKTNGTLWSWGRNVFGQLGINDTNNRSSPVQVGSLTTWSNVACGYGFSLAIKTDGTLWSWGRNLMGQLGQNDVVYRSSPVQVGALTTWGKIDGGSNHCVAIKNDKTLWSWGYNGAGQLGIGSVIYRSSPVQVGSLTTWLNIAVGVNANFSMGLKSS